MPFDVPGLRGYLAGNQFSQQRQQADIGSLTGLLQLQGMLESQGQAAMMHPLQLEQLKLNIQQATARDAALRGLAGGAGGQAAGQAGMALGAPVGDIGPTNSNAARMPTQAPSDSSFAQALAAGVDPKVITALRDITNPKMEVSGNYAYNPRTQPAGFVPGMHFGTGGEAALTTVGPNGLPQISSPPGALDAFSAFQNARQGAQAQYELVAVPDGRGGTIMMPKTQAVSALGGAPGTPPALPGMPPPLPGGTGRPTTDPAAAARINSLFPPAAQAQAATEGRNLQSAESAGNRGLIPSSAVLGRTPSAPETAFGESVSREAGGGAIKKLVDDYDKLATAPVLVENIRKAGQLAAQQNPFIGAFGDKKMAVAQFFNNNIGTHIAPESIANVQELQSRLFYQIMENLKKLDASPSQMQQQIMQESLGKITTDPKALPRIMQIMEETVSGKVDLHNKKVKSAEGRGAKFAYDLSIDIPSGGGAALTPSEQAELATLRQRFGK